MSYPPTWLCQWHDRSKSSDSGPGGRSRAPITPDAQSLTSSGNASGIDRIAGTGMHSTKVSKMILNSSKPNARDAVVVVDEVWKSRLASLSGFTSQPTNVLRPLCPRFDATETSPDIAGHHPTNFKRESDDIETREAKKQAEPVKLDVYADAFVPRWLRDVQTTPQRMEPLPPIPPFPSREYLKGYLKGGRVKKAHLAALSLDLLTLPPPTTGIPRLTRPTTEQPRVVHQEGYHTHFFYLLRLELDAQARLKEQVILWKAGLQVLEWSKGTFVLRDPSVRGESGFGGRVAIGDSVLMRGVYEVKESRYDSVTGKRKDYATGLGRGTGLAFEGRVIAVRKREGLVYMHCPTLKRYIQAWAPLGMATSFEDGLPAFRPQDNLPHLFNLTFMLNARSLCVMEQSTSTIASLLAIVGPAPVPTSNPRRIPSTTDYLTTSAQPDVHSADALPIFNLARQWLFPDETHLRCHGTVLGRNAPIEWYDTGLNDEQKLAVKRVAQTQFPVPYLISGPPGTGKTRTVVETVLQILREQPEAHILLCAPSNPATDTLVLRLRAHLAPKVMFRFNDSNRTFAEVSEGIDHYTYVENDRYSLPTPEIFFNYRVVVTSCMDAAHLVVAQFTNIGVMDQKQFKPAHPLRTSTQRLKPHWTHLIIDEAAQGSEPELLIPISVVVTDPRIHNDNQNFIIPQLVLCGDPMQLGPMVCSEAARQGKLDVSLLERLFQRPLYKPEKRSSISSLIKTFSATKSMAADTGRSVSFSASLSMNGIPKPFTNLIKNYRSHPVILMPPSAIFYDDSLQPCADNGAVAWSAMPVPHLPIKFLGHNHPESSTDEKATWFNKGEIREIVGAIKSMLEEKALCTPPLDASQISVMAPWREQVWKLREELRRETLYAVDVGTVEDFQGRESRVVIISCVRSNPRFLDEDASRGLGLINQRKRMNVAITRAKELLVIVGNGSLLQTDPYWKTYLQFALRHGLYVGPTLDLELDQTHMSKLEAQLLHSDMEPEDLEILTAGRAG